jgi:hypothetical protein
MARTKVAVTSRFTRAVPPVKCAEALHVPGGTIGCAFASHPRAHTVELEKHSLPPRRSRARNFAADLERLTVDTAELREELHRLPVDRWECQTADQGWTLKDLIVQLAYFDDATLLALSRPAQFGAECHTLPPFGEPLRAWVTDQHRHLSPNTVFAWFADSRHHMLIEYRNHEPQCALPWFTGSTTVEASAATRLRDSRHIRELFA